MNATLNAAIQLLGQLIFVHLLHRQASEKPSLNVVNVLMQTNCCCAIAGVGPSDVATCVIDQCLAWSAGVRMRLKLTMRTRRVPGQELDVEASSGVCLCFFLAFIWSIVQLAVVVYMRLLHARYCGCRMTRSCCGCGVKGLDTWGMGVQLGCHATATDFYEHQHQPPARRCL